MGRHRIAALAGWVLVLVPTAFGQVIETVPAQKRPLGELIAEGDLEELENRLEAGVPPDAALVAAARNDAGAVLELLFKLGAKPRGLQAARALFDASRMDHSGAVRALTEAGADFEGADAIGRTLLIFTVENGHAERVKAVLETGVEVDRATHTGLTALMRSVAIGETKKARVLLNRGADANARDRDGWTALAWAVRRADLNAVRLLLSKGADPGSEDRLGWTPLHLAAAQGDAAIVLELLNHGAAPNHLTAAAGTPLIRAVLNGDAETIVTLRAFGANLWSGPSGRGAIDWAHALGRADVFEDAPTRGEDS